VERPAAVEELVAEALRRLFLKPGADRHRGFVEELARGGRLALELVEEKTKKKTESYVFRLFKLEEGGSSKSWA
jgi:metallophosphoesterase superfamily enzyme